MIKILGFLVLITLCNTVLAQGDKGHGGDLLVSEFTGTARNILDAIEQVPHTKSCPNPEEFESAIKEATVSTSFIVFKDEALRDAWNDRANKTIELSRSNLYNTPDSLNFVTLVLHEYMGILGLEKTNDFSNSQNCLMGLKKAGHKVESLRYRLKPISGVIEKLTNGEIFLECDGSQIYIRDRYYVANSKVRLERTKLSDWKVVYDLETGKTEITVDLFFWDKYIYFENRDIPENRVHKIRVVQRNDGLFNAEYTSTARPNLKPYKTDICKPMLKTTYGN
jgi:hypothetical protein